MLPISSPLAVSLLRPSSGRRPLVAGVLSGTSADGIDVALAEPVVAKGEPDGRLRLRALEIAAFAGEPFEAELEARLRPVLDGTTPSLAELARLHRDLGIAFGAAARRVADRHGEGELVLVASHGQTVFHHDGDASVGKVSLQIGDGDFVAEAAGVAAVSDFRQRDCAAGGEGAPLVTLVDDVLFGRAPRPLAVLNLGGMANWTLLPGDGAPATGFDVGPAGALLDGLSRRLLSRPYDDGGRAALGGQADPAMVDELLLHPFLQREGPRSTGRDTFGEGFVNEVADRAGGMSPGDVLATACRFVGEACAHALRRAIDQGTVALPADRATTRAWHIGLAGGGAHNAALARELDRAVNSALAGAGTGAGSCASFGLASDFGVPVDAREALAFAALGVRMLLGEPSTAPGVTGARPGRILGKWSPATVGAGHPESGAGIV